MRRNPPAEGTQAEGRDEPNAATSGQTALPGSDASDRGRALRERKAPRPARSWASPSQRSRASPRFPGRSPRADPARSASQSRGQAGEGRSHAHLRVTVLRDVGEGLQLPPVRAVGRRRRRRLGGGGQRRCGRVPAAVPYEGPGPGALGSGGAGAGGG